MPRNDFRDFHEADRVRRAELLALSKRRPASGPLPTSPRSSPTGLGSRGGTRHLPGGNAKYQRDWRAAHPEYRDRDNLRRARAKAVLRGDDPTLILSVERRPRGPTVRVRCRCKVCHCMNTVPAVCGLCMEGLHNE